MNPTIAWLRLSEGSCRSSAVAAESQRTRGTFANGAGWRIGSSRSSVSRSARHAATFRGAVVADAAGVAAASSAMNRNERTVGSSSRVVGSLRRQDGPKMSQTWTGAPRGDDECPRMHPQRHAQVVDAAETPRGSSRTMRS